ncbi:hypothetical protein MRX96_056475 [Rhipicephalus microplus]
MNVPRGRVFRVDGCENNRDMLGRVPRTTAKARAPWLDWLTDHCIAHEDKFIDVRSDMTIGPPPVLRTITSELDKARMCRVCAFAVRKGPMSHDDGCSFGDLYIVLRVVENAIRV